MLSVIHFEYAIFSYTKDLFTLKKKKKKLTL